MASDPFQLFDEWFAEALASEPNDANAMALATADARGQPHVRMVLLKGHGPDGFVFYTNEQSAKGSELSENPCAALLFHWKSLRRQVRIEGEVERVSDEEADAYFASSFSGFAAWRLGVGPVAPARHRATFEQRFEEMKSRFEGKDVPRPPHWGGYRVIPSSDRILAGSAAPPSRAAPLRRPTTAAGREGLLYP